MSKRGFVHIYTGNGKGKTTASLGLALRAVGAGKKVFIAQFVKGRNTSEIKAIRDHLKGIVIKQYGLDTFITGNLKPDDIVSAREGLAEIKSIVASGEFDVVILDEINIALYYKLFAVEEIIDIIRRREKGSELVLTGRNAPDELIAEADLVTEMREIKHYFSKGVDARKGIEY